PTPTRVVIRERKQLGEPIGLDVGRTQHVADRELPSREVSLEREVRDLHDYGAGVITPQARRAPELPDGSGRCSSAVAGTMIDAPSASRRPNGPFSAAPATTNSNSSLPAGGVTMLGMSPR